MKFQLFIVLLFLIAAVVSLSTLPSCASKEIVQSLDVKKNFERDMIVQVNGVTREGSIAMPLLTENTIHIYAQGALDIFLMKTCGGVFKKSKAWNIQKEVPSGLFGWGRRTIDVKNEVEFTLKATDFTETGVCPLYLTGIDKTTGSHSEAFVAWQTPQYQLKGRMVCNMEARRFDGVEVCSSSATSYTKLVFDEEVTTSPEPGCELPLKTGKAFEWRIKSGRCNYRFEGKQSGLVGVFHAYGFDEIIIR